MLIGLLICAAIGFINGMVTIRFAIPSFIATLGMLFVARSLTVVISGGFPPLLPQDIPAAVFTQFVGPGGLFRMSFIWFVLVAVLASAMLSFTNVGNWIRATGGFLEAAASMGIPVHRVKLGCFMLCSMLAGFAGLIQVLRLGSPLPSIGEGLELQAVAAAVIGGAALAGGIGTIMGGIVGALLIRVIDNGLVLSQVDANWSALAGRTADPAVIGTPAAPHGAPHQGGRIDHGRAAALLPQAAEMVFRRPCTQERLLRRSKAKSSGRSSTTAPASRR